MSMTITDVQKRQFAEEGYLEIPGAVPKNMIETSLRAVNYSIGNIGIGGEDPSRNRSGFFCAELLDAPFILDMYNKTPVMQIAESLMGKGNVLPVERAKTYPRFPSAPRPGTIATARTHRRHWQRHQRHGQRRLQTLIYGLRRRLSRRCIRTLQRQLHRLAPIPSLLCQLFHRTRPRSTRQRHAPAQPAQRPRNDHRQRGRPSSSHTTRSFTEPVSTHRPTCASPPSPASSTNMPIKSAKTPTQTSGANGPVCVM